MKRTVSAVVVSLVLAGTFALAQTPYPQNPPPSATAPTSQEQKIPESTLTGCLIQGSGPTVFILDNARLSTDAKTAEGKKYIVMMADPAGLRNQLNRQISVTGTPDAMSAAGRQTPQAGPGQAEPGAPQAGQKVDERDLPKFSGKTILRVADVCTTA